MVNQEEHEKGKYDSRSEKYEPRSKKLKNISAYM